MAGTPASRRKRIGVGAGPQECGKDDAVGLEAGRVDVGDVVGNDVELALQRGLPRQSYDKCVVHRL